MKRYYVAIVELGRITGIPARQLTVREGLAFVQTYNHANPNRVAVMSPHPIRRATLTARSRSRSS